jgi:hypothetical protein
VLRAATVLLQSPLASSWKRQLQQWLIVKTLAPSDAGLGDLAESTRAPRQVPAANSKS